VCYNVTVGVLFGSLKQTHRFDCAIESVGVGEDICSGGEYEKEVIQVIGEIPPKRGVEYPMACLRKEVEYSWGCSETKWKKHIDVVFPLPFEDQQPVV
jgi:hypothetical protein